ncbi:MAG: hypothetical protein V4560_04710 [Bacteroidota bacterium]
MKFLCVLFSLMVMLLTVRPCCADNCAAKTTAGKSASKEKECAGCSPFFSCGSCTGFIVTGNMPVISIPGPDAVVHFNAYRTLYIKEISSPIWQPPQLG